MRDPEPRDTLEPRKSTTVIDAVTRVKGVDFWSEY
jgi:hypothetical protein